MDSADVMRRFNIASRYMNNQTEDAWRALTLDVMNEARRGDSIPDAVESAAWDILRASYWSDVRGIVDDLADQDFAAEDERTEYVDQSVGGSQWVIYNWRAGIVLAVSDNSDAYEDEIGEEDASENVRACYAMIADVRRLLPAWDDDAAV